MIRYINKLKALDQEVRKLINIKALLEWDQETLLPKRGDRERAEQIGLLEGIIHQKAVAPEIRELLEILGANKETPSGTTSEINHGFIKAVYRRYNRYNKIPNKLVVELAKETSLAQSRWVNARKIGEYSHFKPNLKTLIKLIREKAECLGYEEHPYDPLLDEFEPWTKTSDLEKIFPPLQEKLVTLFRRIRESGKTIDRSFLQGPFDLTAQEEFGTMIARRMGFDFERGRLDVSTHPFTISLGASDIRITTRYTEENLTTGLFGIIHESGHGLYELGFAPDLQGTLLADGASFGIHESQSRLWENQVGRSLPFWQAFLPNLKEYFPGLLEEVSAENFYKAINVVEASHIRVEADEVSYNLHILLRYNLEKRLLSGDLSVEDLPEAWNSESEALLGITPANDVEGVLQDIHWAVGLVGYFPTYTLGNLYSAQFFAAMKKRVPTAVDGIGKGDLFGVFNWLRENIHYPGASISAEELCKRVTGSSLEPDHFMNYLENKYGSIYEL